MAGCAWVAKMADFVGTQGPPDGAADGNSSWVIASGLLYPEDLTDDTPYLLSDLPQRLTGGYSYNTEPLYVTVGVPTAAQHLRVLIGRSMCHGC